MILEDLQAAKSLVSLLDEVKRVVPAELCDQTPARVKVDGTTPAVHFSCN
jgi:hypothetical protein